jgi:hypothetical protein
VRAIVCLVAGALIGYKGNSRPSVPWSLEGRTIPPYTIHGKDDISMDGFVAYSFAVIVPPDITKDQLTVVTQKIIQDQPKHHMIIILYFSDAKDADKEFTVGKAWWGTEDVDRIGKPGDYSRHVLKVERVPALPERK